MPEPLIDRRLLEPVGRSGRFDRPRATFREWVSADGSTPFPAVAGPYHLYVSWACPWAPGPAIGRLLFGLEDVIGMSVVDPIRDERGWAFTGGEYTDPVNGFRFRGEAYAATDPDHEARLSVPVLWDKESKRIVNNESSDILRMYTTAFASLATREPDLWPAEHRDAIDALNDRLYEDVNNAVYAAGFSRDQDDYERIVHRMFATLDEMDERLGKSRFLFGDAPVETDWRLFTTLLRFDAVYNIHFKCSLKRVVDYPNLWPYARDLFRTPGVAETVRFDDIRRHYYLTHGSINPSGIIAVRPDEDWQAPSGRG